MNTHADKNPGRLRRSVAHEVSRQSGGVATAEFVDNRQKAAAQRQLEAMANDSPRAQPLRAVQEMADNSPHAVQLMNAPIQREAVIQKFDAGIGAGWHIHHQDHVKYASTDATRVNFGGRTRRQVGYEWEQKIQANGLTGTKNSADFIACKTWIRNHI